MFTGVPNAAIFPSGVFPMMVFLVFKIRLYIKQPPLSASGAEDKLEWFEYKIKETNMFTVDKYQQVTLS